MPNDMIPTKLPTRKVQVSTRLNILGLLGFQDDSDKTNELMIKKSQILVQKIVNPPEVFSELKNMLEKKSYCFTSIL